MKAAQEIRERFKTDASRPQYHFLPPSNWMNDPNGVIQWNGQYHLFFQYNPDVAVHRNMHWGHAVSDDLLHWQDLPIALAPTPNSPDEGGIFSGCIVDVNGVPTAFYTGVNPGYSMQSQCMATSNDNLLTWQKYDHNPIIAAPPLETINTSDFRDPYVWREGDTWMMAVGSRIVGVGGTVLLYRSQDIKTWDYIGELFTGSGDERVEMWECPNFFKLGDKWVLIVSSHLGYSTGTVIYFVGTYENHRFTPEYDGVLDHAYLYAPLTFEDDGGRRLMWGWLREGRSVEAHEKAGWAGVQSFPRVLSLDANNRLQMEPVAEIESIRGKHHHYENLDITTEQTLDVNKLHLDIELEAELGQGGAFTLSLACSSDGSQGTHITFDADTQALIINREHSSTSEDDHHDTHRAIHQLDNGEHLKLRVLLDGSVLEVIANKRTGVTSRIYPTDFANGLVRIKGKDVIIHQLDIYEMLSIWQ